MNLKKRSKKKRKRNSHEGRNVQTDLIFATACIEREPTNSSYSCVNDNVLHIHPIEVLCMILLGKVLYFSICIRFRSVSSAHQHRTNYVHV